MKHKSIWSMGTLVVVILVVAYVGRDLYISHGGTVACPDGARHTIDVRDFVTQYSGYSVEFEANLKSNAHFSGKLEPGKIRELSESLQQANEFRKFVVVGYNSCAISAAQYAQYGSRFQALGEIGREIDSLIARKEFSAGDRAIVERLVEEYSDLARKVSR